MAILKKEPVKNKIIKTTSPREIIDILKSES